uniref:Cyanocobalamin reductase (cyanide-eliminating) n=1 Tax=Heterorhabditis bacteriophora TaxID=37862 RepID=A0A1I7XPL1_HETBA
MKVVLFVPDALLSMAPVRLDITEESVYLVKNIVDREMTESDGFESYLFKVGSYNSSVGPEFQLPYDQDVMALLIISTPNMFDVSFRRWFNMKLFEV